MELREELMPPQIDQELVTRLTKLASRIDGARPGEWEVEIAEFNRVARTAFVFRDFQGIYGSENQEDWVRRVLVTQRVRPAPNVTRDELIDVVRRVMALIGPQQELYMIIFDANTSMPHASNLIFYPPDYDDSTGTWGRRPADQCVRSDAGADCRLGFGIFRWSGILKFSAVICATYGSFSREGRRKKLSRWE